MRSKHGVEHFVPRSVHVVERGGRHQPVEAAAAQSAAPKAPHEPKQRRCRSCSRTWCLQLRRARRAAGSAALERFRTGDRDDERRRGAPAGRRRARRPLCASAGGPTCPHTLAPVPAPRRPSPRRLCDKVFYRAKRQKRLVVAFSAMALSAASTLLVSGAATASRPRSRVAPVAGALPSAGRAAGACALFAPRAAQPPPRRAPRPAHRARLPPPRSNELNKWCAAAPAGDAARRGAVNLTSQNRRRRSHQDGGDGEGDEYEDDYSEGFDKETMALFTKTLTARVRPQQRLARRVPTPKCPSAAPLRALSAAALAASGRTASTRAVAEPQRVRRALRTARFETLTRGPWLRRRRLRRRCSSSCQTRTRWRPCG